MIGPGTPWFCRQRISSRVAKLGNNVKERVLTDTPQSLTLVAKRTRFRAHEELRNAVRIAFPETDYHQGPGRIILIDRVTIMTPGRGVVIDADDTNATILSIPSSKASRRRRLEDFFIPKTKYHQGSIKNLPHRR